MGRSRLIIGVCAVLAAIAGAYWTGRMSAPATPPVAAGAFAAPDDEAPVAGPAAAVPGRASGAMPALGTPLQRTFSQLQARADGGDADAARRLVRDLDRCRQLLAREWNDNAASERLVSRDPDGMSPAQLRTYQHLLDALETRRQGVREDRELCAGVDQAMLDSLARNIALAARLGDETARACYLARGPLYDARGLLAHPESLRTYRNDATAMIQSGLAAGDWRVVDLLRQAYRPGGQGLLAAVVGTDPAQYYRYLKLYRLGAEPHRVDRIDQELAMAANELDAAQRAQADEWAERTLRRDFHGASTGATPEGWEPCAF